MAATDNKSSPRNALLATLGEKFEVFRECRPLALGIHKALLERMPEIDVGQLRTAMRTHTASTRYLKTLLLGKERFNLDGEVAGEITDEQREVANTALRERFKKAADRRKAEEKLRKDAERELAAQKQRQEKLDQLAARFKRN